MSPEQFAKIESRGYQARMDDFYARCPYTAARYQAAWHRGSQRAFDEISASRGERMVAP